MGGVFSQAAKATPLSRLNKSYELVTVVPLAVLTLVLGLYPSLALRMMDVTVANLVRLVTGQV